MDNVLITITDASLSLDVVASFINDPGAGGIDIFIGTTRDNEKGKNVLYLEYEAYQPMAEQMMRQIAVDMAAKWDIKKIAMLHRAGRVDIGEASVIIGVSSPHRKEAFEACRYGIDTLKKTVPIWKKEFFEGGEVWKQNAQD